MEMHEEQPNVICLALDLPGMHRLVFNGNDDATSILQIVEHESTTLIAYFARCVIDANVKQYMYLELLQHFVWNITTNKWTPRQIGFALGRFKYFTNPIAKERYYLRLILTIVQDPPYLKTYEKCMVISIIHSNKHV
jgi:hypothetical protein